MTIANSDLAHALDQTLSDLITLDLAVRQARRNLANKCFHDVHRLLDGLAATAREVGNRIAARSIRLGHNPSLWAETAARRNALRSVDVDPLCDADAYSAFEQILEVITSRLVVNIDESACDLVTQGLMINLFDRLETVAWKVRARHAA